MSIKFRLQRSNIKDFNDFTFDIFITKTKWDFMPPKRLKTNRYFIKIRRLLRNKYIISDSFNIKRSYIKKHITGNNLVSKIMFRFLIYFTFLRSPYNNKFSEKAYIIFGNISSFLGKYTYAAIGRYFNLTKILRFFSIKRYFNLSDLNSMLSLKHMYSLYVYKFLYQINSLKYGYIFKIK